jgi:hypothetical protein
MSTRNDTAQQRFFDSGKTSIEIENLVDDVKSTTISNSVYIDLFRVNRATQTEQKCIGNVKLLCSKLNMLLLDIQTTGVQCQSMNKDMMNKVLTITRENLQNEIKVLKKYLNDTQQIIHHASKTKLGNCIVRIKQDSDLQREKEIQQLNQTHQIRMNDVVNQIKQIRRTALHFEGQAKKFEGYIEKTALAARRAGFETAVSFTDREL